MYGCLDVSFTDGISADDIFNEEGDSADGTSVQETNNESSYLSSEKMNHSKLVESDGGGCSAWENGIAPLSKEKESEGKSPKKSVRRRKSGDDSRESRRLEKSSVPETASPNEDSTSLSELPDDDSSDETFHPFNADEDTDQDGEKIEEIRHAVNDQYKVSQDLEMKLKCLNIKITWKVAMIHKAEGVKKQTIANLKDIKKVGGNIDYFTLEESENLMNRWEQFCKTYGFSPVKDYVPFMTNRLRYLKAGERNKFLLYLARDLPNRSLSSIAWKFQHLCSNFRRGRYTLEEDELIWTMYKKNKKNDLYYLCSGILKRPRYHIYRRHKRLMGSRDHPIQKFDLNNLKSEKVLDALLKKTNCNSIKDFRRIQRETLETGNIEKLAKACKVTQYTLKKIWITKLAPQLYTEEQVMKNSFLKQLITKLCESNFETWDDVKWSELSKNFYNLSKVFIYMSLRKLVKKYVPTRSWSNFKECMYWLNREYLPRIPKSTENDYYLKRLKIRQGALYTESL